MSAEQTPSQALPSPDNLPEIYADLVERVGTVEDPLAQHVSSRDVAQARRMVAEHLGQRGEWEFMDRLLSHVPTDHEVRERFRGALTDEHGWVHGLINIAAQAHAVILVGRADFPLRAGFQCVSDKRVTHAAFAGIVGLGWLYRNIETTSQNYSSVARLDYDRDASRPGEAVLTKKNLPWYAALLRESFGDLAPRAMRIECQFTEGALSGIPVLFGLPAAEVSHLACESEGAEHCRIRVHWHTRGLLRRIFAALRNLLPGYRRLLAGVGQMEVLIRERTRRLEQAHQAQMKQSRNLAKARAQVEMGKTYAASAAHDINNALGPARTGIEEIVQVLRQESDSDAGPDEEHGKSVQTVAGVAEQKLSSMIDDFEKVAANLPPQQAGRLLDDFEFMARLAGAINGAVPDIYRGINRATDFTEVMNQMTKVDYAEERRAIDLSALLEGMTQKYRTLWEDRGIEVRAELEPGLKVDGWLRVYESVFANLLENAGQAVEGSDQRQITVRLERCGSECRVEVRDSGPGIPEGKRDAVFEFGYTTRPATGKGLGLGYVRNYVTLCGGDIQVDSAPEGGARFLITLPLATEEELPPPPDQV